MKEDRKQENDQTKFSEIAVLLDRYPLCARIVAYFLQHRSAMDTARGIAEWWVQEELNKTQEALHRLVACGVVNLQTCAGLNFYSFTNDPMLQAQLEEYFRQRDH